jgi:hypothetical protein
MPAERNNTMSIRNAAVDLSMKWNDYCKAFNTDTLYVSNDGRTGLATISEGTGDNLLKEDEAEGYVDYWYMESYGDNEGDGGMYMTKELIRETDPTIGQILEELAEYEPSLVPDGWCLLDPAEGDELEEIFYDVEMMKMEELRR